MTANESIQSARTVLVDDDESIRSGLTFYFGKKKMPLETFVSAEHALDYLGRQDADIVIVDFCLPGIDGLQFIRELNSLKPDVGKILVTAYASLDMAVEAIKLGVHDFIQKPFQTGTIELAIEAVLRKLQRKSLLVSHDRGGADRYVDEFCRERVESIAGDVFARIGNSLCRIQGSAQLGLLKAKQEDPVIPYLEAIKQEIEGMSGIRDELMQRLRSLNRNQG